MRHLHQVYKHDVPFHSLVEATVNYLVCICLYFYLSVCICFHFFVNHSVCLYVYHLSLSIFILFMFIYLFVCLSLYIYLCLYLPIYICLYLSSSIYSSICISPSTHQSTHLIGRGICSGIQKQSLS